MAALPSIVQSALGNTFHPAKQIGKGGEGAIYRYSGTNRFSHQALLARQGAEPPRQSRRNDVGSMVQRKLIRSIAALINAIRDPGWTPTIQTVLVGTAAAGPAPLTSALVVNLKRRAYIGIGASAAGAIFISFGGMGVVPGLLALAGGIVANAFVPRELKKLRETRAHHQQLSQADNCNYGREGQAPRQGAPSHARRGK